MKSVTLDEGAKSWAGGDKFVGGIGVCEQVCHFALISPVGSSQ